MEEKILFGVVGAVLVVVIIIVSFLILNHTISIQGPVSLSVTQQLSTVPAGVTVDKATNTIYVNSSVTISMGMIDNLTSDPINNISLNQDVPGTNKTFSSFLREFELPDLPAFLVYNLTNPNIVIKKGVTVTFDAFDLSNYAYHGYMIVNNSMPPPYSISGPESAFDGYIGAKDIIVTGILLPPPENGKIYEESESFTASSAGTYWYLCPVFGHAYLGMYGKILVTS
jgi:rusticyanin